MKVSTPNRRRGSAMFLMLGLIALLLAVVAANNSSSRSLMRELNHLDQKQSEHWNAATHPPTASPAPMNDDFQMLKSEMLRRSMRCFVLGWWGLVPLLAFVPAILALVDFRAVVLWKGRHWNAARIRLTVGAILAGIGLMLTLAIGALVAIAILRSISEA